YIYGTSMTICVYTQGTSMTYIYIHIHTYMHAYMHAYIHTPPRSMSRTSSFSEYLCFVLSLTFVFLFNTAVNVNVCICFFVLEHHKEIIKKYMKMFFCLSQQKHLEMALHVCIGDL
ncbi:unnamed protein product, partial [Oncorhynchus mykiss]